MAGLLPPVSAVADVLVLGGARSGWLTPPVTTVVAPGAAVAGWATTVTVDAVAGGGSITTLHEVVSAPLDGQVLVVSAPEVDGAIWGELMTLGAQRQGAVAAVLDATVRDVPDMAAIGLPVLASRVGVAGPQGRAQAIAIGEPVSVGTATVHPGDLVLCDANGAVCIPAAIVADVLADARRYAEAEAEVARSLVAGEPFLSAYRHKSVAVAGLTTRSPRGGGDEHHTDQGGSS